eukprot:12111751-Ditylum_brightwellii.AAC.1
MALPSGTDRNQHYGTQQKKHTKHRPEEIQHRINILGWLRLRYLEKLGQNRIGVLRQIKQITDNCKGPLTIMELVQRKK